MKYENFYNHGGEEHVWERRGKAGDEEEERGHPWGREERQVTIVEGGGERRR